MDRPETLAVLANKDSEGNKELLAPVDWVDLLVRLGPVVLLAPQDVLDLPDNPDQRERPDSAEKTEPEERVEHPENPDGMVRAYDHCIFT